MPGSAPLAQDVAELLARYPELFTRLPPLQDQQTYPHDPTYTQWEAWLALYHRKKLFIVTPSPNAKRHERCVPTAEGEATLREAAERREIYIAEMTEIYEYARDIALARYDGQAAAKSD